MTEGRGPAILKTGIGIEPQYVVRKRDMGKREKGKLSMGYGLAASTTNNIHTHTFSVRDTNGGTFAQTLIDRSNLNI